MASRPASWVDGQTDSLYIIDRQAGKQAGRQIGRQANRQAGKQAGRQAYRQTESLYINDKQAGKQAGRQGGRQAADGQASRQTDRLDVYDIDFFIIVCRDVPFDLRLPLWFSDGSGG